MMGSGMRTGVATAVATVATVGILTLTALPAAASSSHKTTTTTHPKKKAHKAKGITKAAAGKQYLADTASYNAALAPAKSALNNVTSLSQLSGILGPVVTQLQSADSVILRQQWPSGVRADIKTLVTADGLVAGDLTGLENANVSNAGSIEANLTRDADGAAADSNIVRSDLGLPPAPSS
jgi:hypothetical protein